jgi:hypothetical protein
MISQRFLGLAPFDNLIVTVMTQSDMTFILCQAHVIDHDPPRVNKINSTGVIIGNECVLGDTQYFQ